jgi:hypothetical protein
MPIPSCVCPPAVAIPDITTNPVCPEKYGNVKRLVVGRVSGGDFTDITDETEFDTRLASVTSTKIVIIPNLSDSNFPSSAAIETGKDDNTSPDGEGFLLGGGSVTVTAIMKNTLGSVVDEVKGLMCYNDLAIAIVENGGAIGAIGTTTLIPISNFFVGTKEFGGLSNTDNVPIQFTLKYGWDYGLVKSPLAWDIFSK